MTKEELAQHLNDLNIQYPPFNKDKELALIQQAKSNSLVIVYGGSDDLMEMSGALSEEGYAPGYFFLDKKGLLDINASARIEYAPQVQHKVIKALWCSSEYSWTYETEIPHATFDIMEGNEKYCRGIVFSLDDLE